MPLTGLALLVQRLDAAINDTVPCRNLSLTAGPDQKKVAHRRTGSVHMFKPCRAALFLIACSALLPLNAAAWDRGSVDQFAVLPVGAANPEGITVDKHGDVYVTTFAVTGTPTGKLFVFGSDGNLKRQLDVAGSSNLLLGVGFHPQTNDLLVVDFGGARVLSVNPNTGASSVFTQVAGGAGLNALAFDAAGNVYISDSFQGIVWRTG